MDKVITLFESQQDEFSPQQTFSLIGLAALTALIITLVPIINLLNYPFRLLLTIVHELGHGIAAILTGGDFHNFVISPNGAGLAYTSGGWRFAVIPAGYLGVAIFAALLIMLGHSHRWSRLALGLIGGLMLLMSCWYGRPAEPSFGAVLGSFLTVSTGILLGGVFVRVALKATAATIIFFTHLIAIKAGFTAFSDILGVVGLNLSTTHPNDALSMAQLTGIPAVIWALVWIVMAFIIIGLAIKTTWFSDTS
jgi:hypothetical protein